MEEKGKQRRLVLGQSENGIKIGHNKGRTAGSPEVGFHNWYGKLEIIENRTAVSHWRLLVRYL